jgi:HAD superfamily hydrolase (TIGR01509 family)
MKKLGILFDMDGVLVDSEPVITASACEALNRCGVPAKHEDFKPFTGMGENRFIGGVAEKYGRAFELPMKALCYEIYGELVDRELEIYPGTKPMLEAFKAQGRVMALASSADLIKVRHNLRVAEIPFSTFAAVLTGDDVARKKPFPDIYLMAAEKSGVLASDCVVVEDAVSGVQAAKAAGAYAIGVTTSFDEAALREAGADAVIHDISELPAAVEALEAGLNQGYELREGYEAMDFARVTELLAAMPWSPGISRAEVEKGAANATILVGAFDGEKQIGYARALSDKTRFCYLMDVAVDPDSRRNGVGGAMVKRILNHPELTDVYQWLLFTSRAQEFYRGLGFEETKRAGNWMEIRRERPRR